MKIEVKQLIAAVKVIATEKNLPEEVVQDAIEQALAAAYRKDFGDREQDVKVQLNQTKGEAKVFVTKTVVDDVENEFSEINLADAKKINDTIEVGGEVVIEDTPKDFGRVAAQTAKQVLLQRIRESEREIVVDEYEDKIGTVINGSVARVESRLVRVDLGKAQGILPMSEQIRGEHYGVGQRIKVFLKDVERENRGPQLILSRANTEFIKFLFSNEVPEMENGAVEIKAIAREAGVRTKLAVFSTVPGVDAVGTFVGGHGIRVQAVMSEIGDQEKIDIIEWEDDHKSFIVNALAPTQVTSVELDETKKKAIVKVPQDQLSIAIGKGGQNVRLASKLSGYEIDVSADNATATEPEQSPEANSTEAKEAPTQEEASKPKKKLASKAELEENLLEALESQDT
ncbi:TPA: transcription termination/antitermination protein NusA [Candidatus Saccharibacteria bacterium]|nr:transcription termination/antitermination protein NusA [Candidatus Saccharibacteria bacterium]HIO87434.1 transcription termination/antitermination protein NusA [Candidatus Saccharibacteria bacterium]